MDSKNLWYYAGKYKYLTFLALVLSGISAVLALVPYVYIWKIIEELFSIMPDYSKAVNIGHNGWMAVLFAVLSILVYLAALMCSHISAFNTAAKIRKKMIKHILEIPVGTSSNIGSGKLRRIVDESSAATETYMAHMLPDFIVAMVTPIAMLVLLFAFDWRLGLICLIPAILAFGIMSAMTGKQMKVNMAKYQNSLGEMNNQAVEYVRGIPVVKTFQQSVFSFKKFKKTIDDYKDFVIYYTKNLRKPMMVFIVAINAIFALLIPAGFIFANNAVDLKAFMLDLMFYIIFTPVIVVTLTKIMYATESKLVVGDAMGRINGIMSIKSLEEAEKTFIPKDNSVEFKDASFKYDGSNKNAINKLSFKVEAGKTAALVGPSGGGKTTVAGLISRFWDVTDGEITVGGVNVKNISKADLMNNISYVFQDSKLLKTSIFENVRLSKPSASKDEVMNALHIAQCDDIIEKLSDGIDTVIGKAGVYLSGGEMQRIAIARVILKDAPIVILDEATAFADPENESKVQLAFEKMRKGKTVIMIAHRLTTVAKADTIYVLKDGELKEQGNHDTLIKNNSIYSGMWKEYQTSIVWKISKEAL